MFATLDRRARTSGGGHVAQVYGRRLDEVFSAVAGLPQG